MTFRKVLNLLSVYVSILAVFTFLYILSFHTPLFSTQKVLFYRGLMLLATTTFITMIIVIIVKKKLRINEETLITAILVSIALNLSFFVLFPVSIERSITVYILNTLKTGSGVSRCQGYNRTDLEQKIINEYLIKNQALQKRIAEQSAISFIHENNSCISLSQKGQNFLSLSEIVRSWYGIK